MFIYGKGDVPLQNEVRSGPGMLSSGDLVMRSLSSHHAQMARGKAMRVRMVVRRRVRWRVPDGRDGRGVRDVERLRIARQLKDGASMSICALSTLCSLSATATTSYTSKRPLTDRCVP